MTIQQDIAKARLLGLLIIITLIALALQTYGPQKVLVIDKNSDLYIESIDDRHTHGASISSLTQTENKLILDCEIIASSYQWPYCEISFRLADDEDVGLDLSDYETIKLWAKYSTPQDFGLRLQLINFNSAYTETEDSNSFKYNAIELFDTHERYPQVISLSHMQVPTWWLSQGKIPPIYWGPEFTDVRGLQIATGEGVTPGTYQIVVDRIEIHGKMISDKTLHLALIGLWVLAAMAFFINTIINTKRELRSTQKRQQQLEALNRLLNQEQVKLEEKLIRDPLTGLLNRSGLMPVFSSTKDATPLALIFIDIDHFKNINDTLGHNEGDRVLAIFANILSESTRNHDLLARWGGEEFILACSDTTLEKAIHIAEKLRTSIARYEWPKALHITASFGVAQLMPDESPTDFIARADRALYTAKAQGRNCIRTSDPTTKK